MSDVHFGDKHICNPATTASKTGIPTLAELLVKDLQTDFDATISDITDYANSPEAPLIIAVSGDFTQRASHAEFTEAESFLKKLVSESLLNRRVDIDNVYMIPGNHDVVYTGRSIDERFQYRQYPLKSFFL